MKLALLNAQLQQNCVFVVAFKYEVHAPPETYGIHIQVEERDKELSSILEQQLEDAQDERQKLQSNPVVQPVGGLHDVHYPADDPTAQVPT